MLDCTFIVPHVRTDGLSAAGGCPWGKVAQGWASSGSSGSKSTWQGEAGAGGSCDAAVHY